MNTVTLATSTDTRRRRSPAALTTHMRDGRHAHCHSHDGPHTVATRHALAACPMAMPHDAPGSGLRPARDRGHRHNTAHNISAQLSVCRLTMRMI